MCVRVCVFVSASVCMSIYCASVLGSRMALKNHSKVTEHYNYSFDKKIKWDQISTCKWKTFCHGGWKFGLCKCANYINVNPKRVFQCFHWFCILCPQGVYINRTTLMKLSHNQVCVYINNLYRWQMLSRDSRINMYLYLELPWLSQRVIMCKSRA